MRSIAERDARRASGLATHSVGVFVGYRVLLGAGVLVLVGAGLIA